MNQTVLIIDFGGQYSQLIARKVRECQVYCEVLPWDTPAAAILEKKPVGLIFSGGPASVYEEGAPTVDPVLLQKGIPVLGICYGCQLMVRLLGGTVTRAETDSAREYGRTATKYDTGSPLFRALPAEGISWMSHGDYVSSLPEGFQVIASTEHCPNAGIACPEKQLYGLQFHPEVRHTENGVEMIRRFLYRICGTEGDWVLSGFAEQAIEKIRAEVGNSRVLLGLSGGVDSAVTAVLISRAIGRNLVCVYVDHGLMRKNESEQIERYYSGQDLQFVRVNEKERFISLLKGVTDPEEKRHVIGTEFVRVFKETARQLGGADYLAQGTIYPDVIESGSAGGHVIKSHHNVGGLPEHFSFRGIIEPLRMLFKDEVRELGRSLGMPAEIVERQPFPGPGLAVRILGEVTVEKVDLLREADAIFREVMEKNRSIVTADQYFAVLTNMVTVGVMGDERSYQRAVALRAVSTEDFMTADFTRIPYEVLEEASRRIVNEVPGVNRVVYDITSKPPATVEYE